MKQKEIFIISIAIFLTVIAWVIADIYHASVTERFKTNIETLKPIDYEINANVLEILRNKTP